MPSRAVTASGCREPVTRRREWTSAAAAKIAPTASSLQNSAAGKKAPVRRFSAAGSAAVQKFISPSTRNPPSSSRSRRRRECANWARSSHAPASANSVIVISRAARTAGALTDAVRMATASSNATAAAPSTAGATRRPDHAAFASRAGSSALRRERQRPVAPRLGRRRSRPHDQLSITETPASASHFTSFCPMFAPKRPCANPSLSRIIPNYRHKHQAPLGKSSQSFLATSETFRLIHRRLDGAHLFHARARKRARRRRRSRAFIRLNGAMGRTGH